MFHLFIYLAVIICGASVLALEILGTRLIGPVFGVSLYLWSALIGVTLAALSVGYALGGRLADKKPTLTRFALPIGLAGLWTVAIPWLRYPVLDITDTMGFRTAVLVAATILFFPPLMLLGMVSPYAIRLKTAALEEVGRTAGNLYALSTVASVFAAIGTGFFLIPNIGVARLTYLIGVILLLTAAAGWIIDRKGKTAVIAALVLLVGGVAAYQTAPEAEARPDAGLLAVTQSPYAEIRVLEKKGLRFMLIDGSPHSIVDPADWISDYPYIDVLEISKKFYDEPGRVMVVGLGAGSVIKVFNEDGWDVEAVEIDPAVTQTAYDWFGLTPEEAKIHHTDGRQYFIQNEDTWDVVIMDAFGSSSVPFHLVTEEAFALVHSRLNENGILAMNVEAVGWHDIIVHSLAATLAGQFAHVKVLPMEEPPNRFGNLIIMASDRPLELDDEEFPLPTERWTLEYNQMHAWDNSFIVAPTKDIPILTDDLNPVDIWSDRINLASRRQLHLYFDETDPTW
ncbi:MAG: fused MFS/spermidine synthase [Candidatus Krumholzibacteriota bacterium]